MTTPNRARELAGQARQLADVRRDNNPDDPVCDALEMLATVLVELAADVETLTREIIEAR